MRMLIYALLIFIRTLRLRKPFFPGILKPEQANMDVRYYTVALAVNPREHPLTDIP